MIVLSGSLLYVGRKYFPSDDDLDYDFDVDSPLQLGAS